MCQQYFSVGGQLLDVIGFLIIAREWFWGIGLQGAEQVERRGHVQDTTEDRRYRWEGWMQQYRLRTGLFKTGAVMVICGFLSQAIGSLPPSIVARVGLVSCS